MGLFDFFKRRRERESAVPESEALGSFARAEGQPVVGAQVGGGTPDFASMSMQAPGLMESLEALSELGPALQKAIAEGNVTIQQGESQVLELGGTGLREQIFEIMKQHGIDPDGGVTTNIDAGAHGDMQKQILQALTQHGLDFGAGGGTTDAGSSVNVQSFDVEVKPEDR